MASDTTVVAPGISSPSKFDVCGTSLARPSHPVKHDMTVPESVRFDHSVPINTLVGGT